MIKLLLLKENFFIRPISKDFSTVVKGLAVFLMVIMHYWSNSLFTLYGVNLLNGVCCVALFAFITGYAHAFKHTHSPDSCIGHVKRMFLPFYKQYLIVVLAVGFLCWCAGRAFSLNQILLSSICLKPNGMFDSWWYAFLFMLFCFILNPCMRILHPFLLHGRWIHWCIPLLASIIAFSLPCLFSLCKMPAAFTTIWGHVPVVRAVMFIPYYLVGYMYFASSAFSFRWRGIVLICMLAVCVCWPFRIYDVASISAVDVGRSFLECVILLAVIARLRHVKSILGLLGRVSALWWLLHMPVLSVFSHLHNSVHVNKGISLVVSLALSFAANYAYAYVNRIAGCVWSRR